MGPVPPSPPPDDATFGDPFGPLQQPLSTDLMQAFMRLPATLAAQVEGREGPVDIPSEQAAEAYLSVLQAVMRHLPNMASALDLTRARLTRLEATLGERSGGDAG
jgi:hypothetical protein